MGRIVWWREFSGGALSALLGLPGVLACALVVAGPLDYALFPMAVQSALVSVLGASLLGGWLSGIRGQISGPKIALSLLIAADLATAPNVTPAGFLMLIGAVTALTGVIQIGMGLLRLGSLVRYLPFPVLAGFLTAINLSVLWSQWPLLLGGLVPGYSPRGDLPQPVSLLAIGCAVVATLVAERRWRRLPPAIPGLVAGTAAFYLLGHVLASPFSYTNDALRQVTLSGGALTWFGVHELPLTRQLLPHALALAVLASLDSLFSAASIHKLTGSALHANRELTGQGVTNLLIGLAGGLPVAGSQMRSEILLRMGARTPAAPVTEGVLILLLALFGAVLMSMIPTAAIVGILITAAVSSIKVWGFDPVQRMLHGLRGPRNSPRRRVLLGDLATLGGVLAVSLLWGPSAGVAFGVVAAMALFIAKSGARVVNSVSTLQTRRSTLQRTAAANKALYDAGAQTVIVELRGALFFGSAFAFSQEALARAPREGTLIVVLEQVTDIDSSGAVALADVARACAKLQCNLRLAGRHVLERHQTVLAASGLFDTISPEQISDTMDHALEWAERAVLAASNAVQTRHAGVPLARAGLFQGFGAEELALARNFFEERHLKRGETLFSKGDTVDGLYVIDEGQMGVWIEDAYGQPRRIAAFTPGTMVGEIAFIEGGTRSARVVAEEDSRLWLLKRERLSDIEKLDARIVHLLIANITREIAARLRNTTEDLRRR